ncbi:MAG TPA: hypothetical protein VHM25_23255 [Polyangiaceae bacterium]|jgi:hypothetical protein|nr:hypothetical protein [Polyangiaceae bacterium]
MLRSDHSAFSSGLPLTWLAWLALGLVTAVSALGCKPQIGDKCTVSTNCSTTGDRLCDVTQPDGYCTKFNCEPSSCPEDSVCVNFGTTLSPVDQLSDPNPEVTPGGCSPSQGNSPYKRSFCMANCGSDSDCRPGYRCQLPTEFFAVLAEYSSGQKVCAVPVKTPPTDTSNEVCIGSDAGPEAGGASSTGGSGGAAGSSQGGGSSSAAGGGEGGASGEGGSSGDGGAGG